MDTSNILRGERIRLAAINKDDIPVYASWYEDAGFSRYSDSTPAAPLSQAQWEARLEEQQKAEDGFLFAIRELEEDAMIGFVELDGIQWTHQTTWLGIGLGDRAYWGKGYGREAMELILKFAFHELNLHRVQLNVFSYNERAISLYRKLGFVQEGVMREYLSRDGQRYDMVMFGLLRREWEG